MKKLCLLLLLFNISGFAFNLSAGESNLAPWHIQHAAFIASDAATPPSFEASSRVELPYQWSAQDQHSGWFQLTFHINTAHNQLFAFYLPQVNMNAAVFLNGQFVGGGGGMQPPVDRHWHSPMLVQLPGNLLQRGENKIQIHVVTSQPGTIGQLGQVALGPANSIKPLYEWDYFIHRGVNLATIFLSLLVGIIILFLWFMRRQDEYLWFAMVNLVAAFSYLNSVVIFIPVSTHLWEWLMQTSIGWLPALMALFIHHLAGKGRTRVDTAVIITGLIFFPLLWFAPPQHIFVIAKIWHVIALAAGLIAMLELIVYLKQSGSAALYIVWVCIAVLALCGIHDIFTVMENSSRFWLAYTPLVMILGISILLIQRFAFTAQALETANATLEKRIAAAQQQIEQDMQLITALEKKQAVDQERSRIYRDLHDDLGAKILSLVYKSENSEQKALAHAAMDQLRKIVSSKQVRAVTLNSMIRSWREDCVRRTVEAGILADWKLKKYAADIELDTHIVSQASYVFGEAITNALKHGAGKQLKVRTRCQKGCFIIAVSNDTPAYEQAHAADTPGNGIGNMRRRIESLGGNIRWRTGQSGACVTWFIPLEGKT